MQQKPFQGNDRAIAADILSRWLVTGDFPDRLLDSLGRERGFVMEVVYGAVKWRRELEWLLSPSVRAKPSPQVHACLLVGLYQLWHMDTVEEYAAVHSTVEAVRQLGAGDRPAGFVNAVFRQILRTRDALTAELARQSPDIRFSHPEILCRRWLGRKGALRTEALCRWNNERAVTVVRLHARRITAAEILKRWEAADIKVEPHRYAPDRCFILPPGIAVVELPGYAEGAFMVQDPATLASVSLVEAKPGETVLDACAAPGGKALALAEQMQGQGRLVAMEVHADRIPRLQDNLRRMGEDWVVVVEGDCCDLKKTPGGMQPDEKFDRILLDVPCSNTGVLRRRADARWRFTLERLAQLQKTQWAILEAAARRLKPGGVLVYSTCSLEPEENQEMISTWLRSHPQFIPEAEICLEPPESGTDGAFAQRLRLR